MTGMRELRGKRVLVTGAASGIGRATARRFAREGARLLLADLDEVGLRAIAEELPDVALARRVDVAQADEMLALAEAVHAEGGALDVLVNNAGVGLSGTFVDTSLEDFRWIVGINLFGVIHGCHAFVPRMVERGSGHVVNVSSALGYFAAPGTAAYATTKFGVFGLSEAMREELRPKGVGVTTICPGVVDTGIIGRSRFRGEADADAARDKVHAQYVRRGYGPDKVADAIVSAVQRGVAVRPVTPEAWALYYAKRIAPGIAGRLSGFIASKVRGE